MRTIKRIIIHCSASGWANAAVIDEWHKERGWKGIGYHFVILNGRGKVGAYQAHFDGVVEVGRPIQRAGAHTKGHNADSVGICLIGNNHFTAKQLLVALPELLKALKRDYGLGDDDVHGHRDFNPNKTCPNFDVKWLQTDAR